jgi:phosphatidylinositol N-acetylglucosaminyltransferase subunit Q
VSQFLVLSHFLQARAAKGFAILSVFFFFFLLPIDRVASRETKLVRHPIYSIRPEAEDNLTASTIDKAGHLSTRTITTTRILLNIRKHEIMVTNDGLLRVFWPNGLSGTATPGVMVGWRNSETDIFIITILEDAEVRQCLWKTGMILA